jgi:hypothetical protein
MKQGKAKANLARLRATRDRLEITLEMVAAEASKTSARGSVNASTVSNVLAGRRVSQNVIDALRRLIAAAKDRQQDQVLAS